eukprot:5450391-Alexandrium_andersonii.AAC.1
MAEAASRVPELEVIDGLLGRWSRGVHRRTPSRNAPLATEELGLRLGNRTQAVNPRHHIQAGALQEPVS